MAASIEAAAGGAGASGSADLSHKLNDAAKRLGIKAGATTPLVLRTTDKPWKGAVGGLWAFDIIVEPLHAAGWLDNIGETVVKLRAVTRDQEKLSTYELPPRDDDSWTVSTGGALADIAQPDKEIAGWKPGVCQGSCYDCGGTSCHCCGLENETRTWTIRDGELRGLQQH